MIFLLFIFILFNCSARKKKTVHKTTTTDDKRLQSTLKRIGVNAIPAIEEVNIFKDDVVIQFLNPKGKTHHVNREKQVITFVQSIGQSIAQL